MIAIKSIKNIPKSCILCNLLEHGGYCYYKNPPYELNSRDILDERPKDCPLVEVVTCKDCKHWVKDLTSRVPDDKEYHFCPMIDFNTSEDYYCADAERKEK